MIARIFIPILLVIVLTDLHCDYHIFRRRYRHKPWKRLLWALPGIVMVGYTLALASLQQFAPDDITWLNVYLFLLGVYVFPKFLFVVCSTAGLIWKKWRHTATNYGNPVGVVVALLCMFVLVYGTTVGFHKLTVRHIDLYFPDLPKAFDGYRIVQFSDAHVGTFNGWRMRFLERDVDSINAQQADIIVFTGDLQNMRPQEIAPCTPTLSRLHAKDGVYSILGNHDYADYAQVDAKTKKAYEAMTCTNEKALGWQLLRNEHRVIRRDGDSLIIAGEENDGMPPFPSKANMRKTLRGIDHKAFVVMLQHDPTAWRRNILTQSQAQLTLSGHTHNAQFSMMGWSPSHLIYKESYGLYLSGLRALYVTSGIGGFVPFRFGASAEIVVFTLHKQKIAEK